VVILRRAPALVSAAVRLDERQRAALASGARVLRVLGGPGSGKSTLAVELVVDAVRLHGLRADACLMLTSSRSAAAGLRQRVTARLDGTSTESLARTWQAFGFGILRAEAALHGQPAPRLLNGPEQDVILRDLLAGHESGEVPGPTWPAGLGDALRTRGFRNELRDLLMRTVEHGLGPDDLARLGAEHDRPEWVAAAQVLRASTTRSPPSAGTAPTTPPGCSRQRPSCSRTTRRPSTGSTSASAWSSSTRRRS
jgi:superfamily I DNA/RNA helicase